MSKPQLKEILLTPAEAAKMLRVTRKTLEKWRGLGGGPEFIKVSKRVVRYREDEVRRFLRENTRNSTWDDGTWVLPEPAIPKEKVQSAVRKVLQDILAANDNFPDDER